MSRGRSNNFRKNGDPYSHSVTVRIDHDTAQQLDQFQNAFGLETRGSAILALMKAGMSSVPMDTAIFEISQASVREHRRWFTDALAKFFEDAHRDIGQYAPDGGEYAAGPGYRMVKPRGAQ